MWALFSIEDEGRGPALMGLIGLFTTRDKAKEAAKSFPGWSGMVWVELDQRTWITGDDLS